MRTHCYPMDLEPYGKTLFVADGHCGEDGLVRVDISEPAAPRIVESLPGRVGRLKRAAGFGGLIGLGPERVLVYPLGSAH